MPDLGYKDAAKGRLPTGDPIERQDDRLTIGTAGVSTAAED
jgi:hypothetical protein